MDNRLPQTDRRNALRGMVGLGAAAVALPLFPRIITSPAQAQAAFGVQKGMSDLVHIKGSAVEAVPMAEWETASTSAEAAGSPLRYLMGAEAAKAPKDAAHYTVKTFDFPLGSIRVLTFKKGSPLLHQISFETEIFFVSGSATLSPLFGLEGKTEKINAGDALFQPGGMLRNPKCSEDTVLVTWVVGNAKQSPKGSIVRGKGLKEASRAEWQENGKDVSARDAAAMKKAPKDAVTLITKRYEADGNSIRHALLKKGTRTSLGTTSRNDVLIYLVKGRLGRKEGDQHFEMVAGDAMREKMGNPGYWEVPEDSIFLATDAPFNPAMYSPTMVAR